MILRERLGKLIADINFSVFKVCFGSLAVRFSSTLLLEFVRTNLNL